MISWCSWSRAAAAVPSTNTSASPPKSGANTIRRPAPAFGTFTAARNHPYSHFAPQRVPGGIGLNRPFAACPAVRWSAVTNPSSVTASSGR